jgi:hypothetical protein
VPPPRPPLRLAAATAGAGADFFVPSGSYKVVAFSSKSFRFAFSVVAGPRINAFGQRVKRLKYSVTEKNEIVFPVPGSAINSTRGQIVMHLRNSN